MTPGILNWLERMRREHPFPAGRVLEVGAFDVNGNPRGLFPDATEYIGVDQQAGPNVDRVMPAIELTTAFDAGSFDTVVCCEMLEHDPAPIATAAAMKRLLRPGGVMIVTSPANGFPEHRYPKDYWRIMPDAMREVVFSGFEVIDVTVTGDGIQCGIGRLRFLE